MNLAFIDLCGLDFHPPHPPSLVCAASLNFHVPYCVGARKKEREERNSCFHNSILALLKLQQSFVCAYCQKVDPSNA